MGPGGKIHYLKNISGLWLVQELRRDLMGKGRPYTYNELEHLARGSQPFYALIDPDDGAFASPGGMAGKIRAYCRAGGQPVPETDGQLARCVYESLALKYRFALEQVSRCASREFTVLHLLGGGAKDGFLCQLAADSLGLPVTAGPAEATALGNILLQLVALGEVKNVDEGREIAAREGKLTQYEPLHTPEWEEAYGRFIHMIHKED